MIEKPRHRSKSKPLSGECDNHKVTIGIVVPDLNGSGGVQTIVEALVRQIEANGLHDYLIVSLATSASDKSSLCIRRPSSWIKGIVVRSAVWRGRPITHVGCYLAEFEFMRYLKRKSLTEILKACDLIQVVSGLPAWGCAVLDCGRPVSIWAATRVSWERRRSLKTNGGILNFWRSVMTKITNQLDIRAIRNADRVLVMNSLMRNYAKSQNSTDLEKVVVVPPGVDILWFQPSKSGSKDRLDQESHYFLSVGRFSDLRKNPEMLVLVMAQLKNRLAQLPKLILAGSSPPPAGFWKLVEASGLSGMVIFKERPNAKELRQLYTGATAFVLSSDEEGFGMVILEAMACGVPVVATRCGGPEGILTENVDGFLVEPGDVRGFTEKLIRICTDRVLNLHMGERARETVESRFSEPVMGAVFFETWKKLLGDHLGTPI